MKKNLLIRKINILLNLVRRSGISQPPVSWSCMATSTPDATKRILVDCTCSPDISIIERPPSPPTLISDVSIEDLQEDLRNVSPFICSLPMDSSSSGPSLNAHIDSGPKNFEAQTNYQAGPDLQRPSICINPETSKISLNSDDSLKILCQFTSRSCLNPKESPKNRSIHVQNPEREDKKCQECVEELFFDTRVEKNSELISGGRCICEDRKPEFEDEKYSCDIVPLLTNKVGNNSCSEIKDSGGVCSLEDSATGSCDANTNATYYHNKLISTLQILQNKEETIRVQAESLAVAEGRIVVLTERSTELRKELDRKSKELHVLRKTLECCRVEKVDVSISETENQADIVRTLQNNLNVIEELYRECFYETAKQEDLIDMLRKSYLEVRAMEKQKSDQIGRLQTVINTQKWSLDRCQDIALEVDNLKMEISNFLCRSTPTNNDSGMWERSEESFPTSPGVQEELQDVMEQLLHLRELLTTDGAFDLEAENKKLKCENDALMIKITELCGRNSELEKSLTVQENHVRGYKKEIEMNERQLACLREEVSALTENCRDKISTCEKLTTQLRQTQVLLTDKSNELELIQQQCNSHQATINVLKQELEDSQDVCKENCRIRSEVSQLNTQVSQWREQLAESENRVRTLEAQLRHAKACYREKESNVSELHEQLEQAQSRGAALCADARRALCSVRQWARCMRDKQKEQQNKIKSKDEFISILQHRLENFQSNSIHSINETSCSKCSSPRQQSFCTRRSQCCTTDPSEIASCSSAPTPPRRKFKKNSICGDVRCSATPWLCDESTQHFAQRDEYIESRPNCCIMRRESSRRDVRDISPIDEVFTRVEQLSEALADGYRRWTKTEPR